MLDRINESLESKLNFKYILAQGLYWMMVCVCVSFASAYLTGKGYGTFAIGFLLAISFLIAAILQQIISIYADSSTRFNVIDILAISAAILSVDMIIAALTPNKGFWAGFTFIVGAVIATIIQPFLNALNFHLEKYKVNMNYGVARANGSFCFFVVSLIAGALIQNISVNAAPFIGFIVAVLFVAVLFWINTDLKNSGIDIEDEYDPFEVQESKGFSVYEAMDFLKAHKMFFIFLIGMMGYYFGHIIVNNFLYQIVVNVGGNASDNGGLLAIQAIVELPAMIFFYKLRDVFGNKALLAFSGIFYVVKIFFTAIATTVGMLYFSMIFQALAFAIFIPASVHFVDEIMDKKDAVKGQGFVTVAMTISQLLASLLGGFIINISSVNAALWFGFILSMAGAIVSVYGLVRINSKK
ncbi:MAG: MFS transporter [Pseudobutyrivibrio sp.]|nr:MFS transporter [Pseudobutyrivibrio sp.]